MRPIVLVLSSLVMLAVLVLYLLVPLRITMGMLYPGSWTPVALAFAALVLAEGCVVVVLRYTTGRHIQAPSGTQASIALQSATAVGLLPQYGSGGTRGGEIVVPFPGRGIAIPPAAGGAAEPATAPWQGMRGPRNVRSAGWPVKPGVRWF